MKWIPHLAHLASVDELHSRSDGAGYEEHLTSRSSKRKTIRQLPDTLTTGPNSRRPQRGEWCRIQVLSLQATHALRTKRRL